MQALDYFSKQVKKENEETNTDDKHGAPPLEMGSQKRTRGEKII